MECQIDGIGNIDGEDIDQEAGVKQFHKCGKLSDFYHKNSDNRELNFMAYFLLRKYEFKASRIEFNLLIMPRTIF